MEKKNKNEDIEFEELKKRALQPFKPILTKEDILKHENEMREKTFENLRKMKDNINDYEKANIRSRSDFEYKLG